jgi:cell division septum initiation protein DivIVA
MPLFSRRKLDQQPGLGFGDLGLGDPASSIAARAAEILQLAQETADQVIADAEREAQRIISEARQEADRIIDEARARAQGF